jgi:hypothetical protein
MAGYDPVTARELPMSVSQRPTGVIEEGRAAGLIRRELPAATTLAEIVSGGVDLSATSAP